MGPNRRKVEGQEEVAIEGKFVVFLLVCIKLIFECIFCIIFAGIEVQEGVEAGEEGGEVEEEGITDRNRLSNS